MTPTGLPPANDAARADVGLVSALAMELNHFFDRCEKVRSIHGSGFRIRGGRLAGIRIAAVESGVGLTRAQRATLRLIDGHRPPWVISCGFAGALADGIAIGDVVVADSVVRPDGSELDVPHGMAANPAKGLHVGRFVSADHVVRTIAEKRELAAKHDAIACDMETYAVAAACRDEGVPFMAVRAITDDLKADLPAEVHALLVSSGAGRVGATLGAIWNRPESVKDLWKLRENAVQAARRLAKFLPGVIEQLHAATRRESGPPGS